MVYFQGKQRIQNFVAFLLYRASMCALLSGARAKLGSRKLEFG